MPFVYDPRVIWLALAALLWTFPAAAAEGDLSLDEVTACPQLQVPEDQRV